MRSFSLASDAVLSKQWLWHQRPRRAVIRPCTEGAIWIQFEANVRFIPTERIFSLLSDAF